MSKRWRNLWKSFPNLIISSTQFEKITFFNTFLLKFLSHRDRSNSLRNIVIGHDGFIQIPILNRLFKYAMSHNVEKFTIDVHAGAYRPKDIIISNTMLSGTTIGFLYIFLLLCCNFYRFSLLYTLYFVNIIFIFKVIC